MKHSAMSVKNKCLEGRASSVCALLRTESLSLHRKSLSLLYMCGLSYYLS